MKNKLRYDNRFTTRRSISQRRHLIYFVCGVMLLCTLLVSTLVFLSTPRLSYAQASCNNGNGDLGGTIFRDHNSNGIRESTEAGFIEATVTAYDEAGNSTSAVINADGSYNFAGIFNTATEVRLEFTGIPDWVSPTSEGSNNKTDVQFYSSTTCDADFGIHNPADYCQDNVDIATACFVYGDQLGESNVALQGNFEDNDVLVTLSESEGSNSSSESSYDLSGDHKIAAAQDVGSVWGLAYQRGTDVLFSSTFIKKHVGLGPTENPTTIYSTIVASEVSGAWLTLDNTRPDPHDNGTTDFLRDHATFDLVGKEGLGDIDISEDDKTLYTIDLGTREFVEIPINVDSTAGTPNKIDIISAISGSIVGSGDTQCPDEGDLRPFGIAVNDGTVYISVTCTAESTVAANDLPLTSAPSGGTTINTVNRPGDKTKLHGYIYTWDGGTGFDLALDFPLDYARGCSDENNNLDNCERSFDGRWNPWVNEYPFDPNKDHTGDYPQPLISDIEFTNGDMIIGMMDRYGHQWGGSSVTPYNDEVTIGSSTGDILYACASSAGGWTLEELISGDSSCGTTGQSNNWDSSNAPFGLASTQIDEYYHQDNYAPYHSEVSQGGLGMIPGRSDVIITIFDPLFPIQNEFFDGGLGWYDNTTGDFTKGVRLYDGDANMTTGLGDFGKAAGLGDVIGLCIFAPIQIGNYVWLDEDGNGIQDPEEAPINGATVNLYDSTGTLVGTTTTSPDGEYYFDNSNVTLNGADGLVLNANYVVRLDNPADYATNGSLDGYDLTSTGGTVTSRAVNDLHDSDATEADAAGLGNTYPEISYTVGSSGENNHSLDIGFFAPGTITGNVSADTDGDTIPDMFLENVILELLDSNGASVLDTNGDPITTTTDANGDYIFDNVAPGDYQIAEQQPDGYEDLSEADGGDDGDNPDNGIVNNIPVTVDPGETDSGNNFIEALTFTAVSLISDSSTESMPLILVLILSLTALLVITISKLAMGRE